MHSKTLLKLVILTLTIFGCSGKQTPKEEKASVIAPIKKVKKTTKQPTAIVKQHKDKVFKQLANFPTIKDTTQFIADLRQVFNLNVEESPVQKENQKISVYKKVKINGSNKDYYFIEYDWNAGCTATYPWKYQLLLTTDGKLVKLLDAKRCEFVHIFKKQNPFLLTTIVSGHGNGGHCVYRVSADSLENVYEGYYNYDISTYDADETISIFQPYELNISFKDNNQDGYNDIIFSGQKLMLGKYTKDSLWYDVENGKPFTVEHPASKIPIKYVFLYDKKTEHFKAKDKRKFYD